MLAAYGAAHVFDGLVEGASQSLMQTMLFSIVIFHVSFVVFWFVGNPRAAECLASLKRKILFAGAIGTRLGLLACLAGALLVI